MSKKIDNNNQQPHYNTGDIECIQAIQTTMTTKQNQEKQQKTKQI